MNLEKWSAHFAANDYEEELDWSTPVTLSEESCQDLVSSIAIFQLGETGEGSTLYRYAERIGKHSGYERYPEILRKFINEEHRHARILKGLVYRLDGEILHKQWSNGLFRKMRKLINLEFQVQLLLTAEIIAEAYYDLLRQHVDDSVIHQACIRIIKDEVGHLGFHADFFHSWTASWAEPWRMLWRFQFNSILAMTQQVVWRDHKCCFQRLGVTRGCFFNRVAKARRSFLARTFRSPKSPATIPQASQLS